MPQQRRAEPLVRHLHLQSSVADLQFFQMLLHTRRDDTAVTFFLEEQLHVFQQDMLFYRLQQQGVHARRGSLLHKTDARISRNADNRQRRRIRTLQCTERRRHFRAAHSRQENVHEHEKNFPLTGGLQHLQSIFAAFHKFDRSPQPCDRVLQDHARHVVVIDNQHLAARVVDRLALPHGFRILQHFLQDVHHLVLVQREAHVRGNRQPCGLRFNGRPVMRQHNRMSERIRAEIHDTRHDSAVAMLPCGPFDEHEIDRLLFLRIFQYIVKCLEYHDLHTNLL